MFQTEYFVKKFIGAACLPHTEPWGLCPVLHSRGHNGVHLGGGPKLKVTLHFIVSTRQAWVTWDAIYVYLVHSSGSSRDSFCLAPMGLTTEGITTAEEATDWGQTSLDVLKLIKKPTSVTSQAMLPVANHCPVGHTSQRLHSLQVSHWRRHFNVNCDVTFKPCPYYSFCFLWTAERLQPQPPSLVYRCAQRTLQMVWSFFFLWTPGNSKKANRKKIRLLKYHFSEESVLHKMRKRPDRWQLTPARTAPSHPPRAGITCIIVNVYSFRLSLSDAILGS